MSRENYSGWAIDSSDYPKNGSLEEKIKFFLRYGQLAPSIHNTQPWEFEIQNDSLLINPKMNKHLKYADERAEGIFISLGAFVENIVLAASVFGFACDVSFSRETIAMTISEQNNLDSNSGYLKAIIDRYSEKRPFDKDPISKVDLKKIEYINHTHGVNLKIIDTAVELKKYQDIHLSGAKQAASNSHFVKELAGLMRPNNTGKSDGMPGFVSGIPYIPSIVAPAVLKLIPSLFRVVAEHDRPLLESSSLVIVYSVDTSSPRLWFETGRILERIWLDITLDGLKAHPMAAAVYGDAQRNALKRMLDVKGEPVIAMRIGYSSEGIQHSPREKIWN